MTRRRWVTAAWSIGLLGLSATAVEWRLAPESFPHAWLSGLVAWVGWPLGCMGLLLIHSLTGGEWGYVIRRQLTAGISTLALLPFVLAPLAFVLPRLYPWMNPESAAHLGNSFYLNVQAFIMRSVIYLSIWFGVAGLILRALRSSAPKDALARIAPAGLIVLAITVTFASIDMVMSLDPNFASSVFGMMTIAEMGLFALAVSIFAAMIDSNTRESSPPNLGRLLLSLLVLWAYLDFMQLLIVWQSDLPKEAAWYLPRLEGPWGKIAALIACGHFALPFAFLLSPSARRSRKFMASIAGLLIVFAIIRSWWLVMPASNASFSVTVIAATIGTIGVASAIALRAPVLPVIPSSV